MLKWVELGVDDGGHPWGTMVAVAEVSHVKPASHWPQGLSVFRQALLAALADSGFEDRPFADGPVLQVADIKWVKGEFVDSETEAGRREALRKQFARKMNDAQQRKLVGVRVADDRTLIWLVKADQ
jgi:hypothetical protein